MSDNRLVFISRDPGWQPTFDDAGRAVSYLATISPNADEICVSFSERMIFHTGSGNWSGVRCPACRTDLEDWFFATMRQPHIFITDADLRRTTPCCSSDVSLNDLDYVWPAGFGRFSLAAMNPDLDPNEDQEREIGARLGTKVRKIWEHI